MISDWRNAPCRPTNLPEMDIQMRRADDGSIWLQHGMPLQSFEPWILAHLTQQAATQPDKTAYAQRGPGGALAAAPWERCSYAQLNDRVRRIAGWFQAREAGGQVLLLLTGNSVNHALVRLGAIAAGVIVCPVSAGYVAATGDLSRLRHVMGMVAPTYLFAEREGDIAAALDAFDSQRQTLIVGEGDVSGFADCVDQQTLLMSSPIDDFRNVDPDAPAAYMLTSGSTGRPKAVPHSQRMLLSNLHQAWQILGRAAGWSEHMLDWLPWSHASGAFNLYAAAVFGGSLYIDDGKPVPGLVEETVANLREMPLSYFCNVPLGYGVLVEALRQDAALREVFFKDLRLMLYGGAGLSQPVMDALQSMAVEVTGHRIMMTTGYGLTESTSGCMAIYFPTDKVGIGLPMPGVQTRLVPIEGDRFEIRMRGPNIMTGYLDNPDATAEAFDEEGCFRTGDAARFHDPQDVTQGLAYAGRLVEEFKLASGTWVRSGAVRAELLAALSPAVADVLLCGINEAYLSALLVPNINGLREIAAMPDADGASLMASSAVHEFMAAKLAQYNARHPGSSTALKRLSFMRELPDPQRHEISDKGTINQRIAADNRTQQITEMYADRAGDDVIEA
ncbi:MAG: AMP-binding protein [Congregibacter sp.]